MKKLSFLIVAALLVFAGTFTSCEKIADEVQNSTEVTINTTLDAPMVAVPDAAKVGDGQATFTEESIIDINNNEDLADYLEKIENIEVTKISLLINSVTPTGLSLRTADFSITDNVTDQSFAFQMTEFDLVEGAFYEIGETTPGWTTVNEILNSRNAATVRAQGTINNETFTVGFTYTLHVKVLAKP